MKKSQTEKKIKTDEDLNSEEKNPHIFSVKNVKNRISSKKIFIPLKHSPIERFNSIKRRSLRKKNTIATPNINNNSPNNYSINNYTNRVIKVYQKKKIPIPKQNNFSKGKELYNKNNYINYKNYLTTNNTTVDCNNKENNLSINNYYINNLNDNDILSHEHIATNINKNESKLTQPKQKIRKNTTSNQKNYPIKNLQNSSNKKVNYKKIDMFKTLKKKTKKVDRIKKMNNININVNNINNINGNNTVTGGLNEFCNLNKSNDTNYLKKLNFDQPNKYDKCESENMNSFKVLSNGADISTINYVKSNKKSHKVINTDKNDKNPFTNKFIMKNKNKEIKETKETKNNSMLDKKVRYKKIKPKVLSPNGLSKRNKLLYGLLDQEKQFFNFRSDEKENKSIDFNKIKDLNVEFNPKSISPKIKNITFDAFNKNYDSLNYNSNSNSNILNYNKSNDVSNNNENANKNFASNDSTTIFNYTNTEIISQTETDKDDKENEISSFQLKEFINESKTTSSKIVNFKNPNIKKESTLINKNKIKFGGFLFCSMNTNFKMLLMKFIDKKSLLILSSTSKEFYKNIRIKMYKYFYDKILNNKQYMFNIFNNICKLCSNEIKSKTFVDLKIKYNILKNSISSYNEIILKDIIRTFPSDPSFEVGSMNYKKLYNILVSYSNFNKKIGYAQGLNFIVANSLFLFKNEEKVFLFLDGLINRFGMYNYLGIENYNLEAKLKEFSNILKKYCPEFIRYLSIKLLSHEFFSTGWLLTLFSNSMNRHKLYVTWCFMYIFGWKFFYCFIVQLLLFYGKDIYNMDEFKLSHKMKELLKEKKFINDYNEIIRKTLKFMNNNIIL